jgi:hypothetical protein
MKVKMILKHIREMTDSFDPDMLPPYECANFPQFGKVYLQQAFPKKCYATGESLTIAVPNQIATAVLHAVDSKDATDCTN